MRSTPAMTIARTGLTPRFAGKGNRKKTTRAKSEWTTAIGSRKDLSPGIRRERRWLSMILTAAYRTELNTAVVAQLNRIGHPFLVINYFKFIIYVRCNAKCKLSFYH